MEQQLRRIRELERRIAEQDTLLHQQQGELEAKEEVIQAQCRELEDRETRIQEQYQELTAKEEVIQSLVVFQRSFSIRYWFWHLVRPFLFEIMSKELHKALNVIYSWFRPTLNQYPPVPISIPKRYYRSVLPPDVQLPVVSIVTPTLNQSRFLDKTIASVLGQNYPNLEYIIQDGGSTDGTVEILEQYRTQIKHIESCLDSGQANGINRGFRHATGEIMAWLNSDDMLLPGAIPYIVNFLLKHPDVDVVYGHRINMNQDGNEVGRRILPPHSNDVLRWSDLIPQETLFWRRRLWEKTGGYIDESFQYAMDWELLLRFLDAGAKFVRLPRFLGAFRVHPEQKTLKWVDIGQAEADRLRQHYHGRPIPWSETRRHIKYYILGSTWRYVLYRLGLFWQ